MTYDKHLSTKDGSFVSTQNDPDMAPRIRANPSIRRSLCSDIMTMVRINAQGYASDDWGIQRFTAFKRLPDAEIFVATINGVVVGFICFTLNRGSIVVVKLAVDPRHRRTGVGSMLIGQLQLRVRTSRYPEIDKRVYVVTTERNGTAQLFLRSRGFKSTGSDKVTIRGVETTFYEFEYTKPER